MQENNSQSSYKIQWPSKNQKFFDYTFKTKTVLGLSISFDNDNYRNWKKLLYGLDNFSNQTQISAYDKALTEKDFINAIKLISPRPLDILFETYQCSDIYSHLLDLNKLNHPIEHHLFKTHSEVKWKNLPTYKKVLLQILCSIDITKKINFIFLEKMAIQEQHQSFFVETLKHIATKYDTSVVILGQNKSLTQISWLPLLPAPIEKHHFVSVSEDEDYDEAAS